MEPRGGFSRRWAIWPRPGSSAKAEYRPKSSALQLPRGISEYQRNSSRLEPGSALECGRKLRCEARMATSRQGRDQCRCRYKPLARNFRRQEKAQHRGRRGQSTEDTEKVPKGEIVARQFRLFWFYAALSRLRRIGPKNEKSGSNLPLSRCTFLRQ